MHQTCFMRWCYLAHQHTWNCLHYLFGHYLPLIVRELYTSFRPCQVGLRLWLLFAPQHSHLLRFGQKLLQNISLFSVPGWGGCSGYEQHSQQCKGHDIFSWHVWKTTRKFNYISSKVTMFKNTDSLPARCVMKVSNVCSHSWMCQWDACVAPWALLYHTSNISNMGLKSITDNIIHTLIWRCV